MQKGQPTFLVLNSTHNHDQRFKFKATTNNEYVVLTLAPPVDKSDRVSHSVSFVAVNSFIKGCKTTWSIVFHKYNRYTTFNYFKSRYCIDLLLNPG